MPHIFQYWCHFKFTNVATTCAQVNIRLFFFSLSCWCHGHGFWSILWWSKGKNVVLDLHVCSSSCPSRMLQFNVHVKVTNVAAVTVTDASNDYLCIGHKCSYIKVKDVSDDFKLAFCIYMSLSRPNKFQKGLNSCKIGQSEPKSNLAYNYLYFRFQR